MSGIMLGLDILIILMLGATIFYAVRLSQHLSIFRSNRSEMERLIRELSSQITRAQEGISVLDDMSSTHGDHLRQMIAKAQGLADELEIITQAGNSLAERLEKLATKNRAIADDLGQSALNNVFPGQKLSSRDREDEPSRYEDRLPRANKERVVPSLEPSFAIRDPDYDDDDTSLDLDDGGSDTMSKAERDLMTALKSRGRRTE